MNRQLFQYHPTIGHIFVPGIKARVEHEGGGYLLRTNREGFRCRHAFEKIRSTGRFRILLFGDSYTAGDGVSDRFRYGDVLETLLPDVEVFNFGVSGTGTDQQYLIWKEMAREIEHDLVVIGVLVENIRRIVARFRPYETPDGSPILLAKPYFTRNDAGELSIHNVPVPREAAAEEDLTGDDARHVDRGGRLQLLRRLASRLGPAMKDRLQRWSRFQPLPAYNRRNHPDWLLMRAILERWTSESSSPFVICPIPVYQYVEETSSARYYQARFQELSDPPRIVVHDPLPDFQKVSRAERRSYRFEVDCHLTPSAHEVLARSLARTIAPMVESKATQES